MGDEVPDQSAFELLRPVLLVKPGHDDLSSCGPGGMKALEGDGPVLRWTHLVEVRFSDCGFWDSAGDLRCAEEVDCGEKGSCFGELLPSFLDTNELGVKASVGRGDGRVLPALREQIFRNNPATKSAKHQVVAEANNLSIGVGGVDVINDFFHAREHIGVKTVTALGSALSFACVAGHFSERVISH